MKKDVVRQIITAVLILATLAVNGLADAVPFNGLHTGVISDRFHVLFVPAGYVFAIWGVIYIGLIAFGIYQALPSQRENPLQRRIAPWFALSCLANIAWLFLWHYLQFPLTLVAMLVLLAVLIAIYLELGVGQRPAKQTETWLVRVPFSVYLGWISVATAANITELLDYLKWRGFGLSPQAWLVVVLAAVLAIAALMSLRHRDVAFVLVILWALVGVGYKNSTTPLAWIASLGTAVLVAIGLLYSLLRRKTIK
jgi:hypothetical protein